MKAKRLSDERLLEMIATACREYEGDTTVLESAIGALAVGRVFGWHGLRLMHSSRTFKRYEDILGVKFRDVLPERTAESWRLRGIRMADGLGKFWQVITAGMVPGREAAMVESR